MKHSFFQSSSRLRVGFALAILSAITVVAILPSATRAQLSATDFPNLFALSSSSANTQYFPSLAVSSSSDPFISNNFVSPTYGICLKLQTICVQQIALEKQVQSLAYPPPPILARNSTVPSGCQLLSQRCSSNAACSQSGQVCGTDGHTYSNLCNLLTAGTTLDHYGMCISQVTTNPNICDGISSCQFGNTCAPGYSCSNFPNYRCVPSSCLSSGGTSSLPAGSCGCPNNQDTVCAANGQTYQNGCLAECANQILYYPGACNGATASFSSSSNGIVTTPPPNCNCGNQVEYVCAVKSGKEYQNQCLAMCAGEYFYFPGHCS